MSMSKPVSVPSAALPTSDPATNAATPAPNCWIAALRLMKLPRTRGSALPDTSAIAGPKRPVTRMKNTVDSGRNARSGKRGRCVIARIGATEASATTA